MIQGDTLWISEVRANAETPADARQAKEFGAEGIGLVRTEHMFFEGQRIVAMRQMILATDEADRRQALDKLLVMQREDITELFRIMDGNPVTVRLLDPPLHEFIPHTEAEMALVAKAAGVPLDRVRRRAAELQEANPMLGHRGCRLAITYPEICEMQARAIFEAAAEVGRSSKKLPVAEVMVPLVATVEELKLLKGVIEKTADAVKKEQGITFTYKIGTMIELPRAALQAGRLAEMAEFFSFGTNDLTQTTYGLSRDDAGSFLPEYKAKGIVEHDPFASLDPDGVGELITMAVQRGRSTRPEMKMGICGEHGGDPASIEVCEKIGLDYVSCSPFRVPVARLAAAQSALKTKGEQTKQSSTKATKPRVQNFGPWWAKSAGRFENCLNSVLINFDQMLCVTWLVTQGMADNRSANAFFWWTLVQQRILWMFGFEALRCRADGQITFSCFERIAVRTCLPFNRFERWLRRKELPLRRFVARNFLTSKSGLSSIAADLHVFVPHTSACDPLIIHCIIYCILHCILHCIHLESFRSAENPLYQHIQPYIIHDKM